VINRWQLQQAKHQFSRLVKRAETEGPQVVTRHGEDVAVVLGMEDYRRLRSEGGAFKQFLAGAPDLGALEIERSTEPARTIEL
jgi:prevent-host-death family protein